MNLLPNECYDITSQLKEEQIRYIERNLKDIEQIDCPVKHSFSPGLYIREVTMYAGSYIIGHRHKEPHLNIMIAGKLSLQNPDGGYDELEAPLMYTAQPGRKIAYIHEDTVWLNVWATDEQDVEKLEAMFLDKTEEWIQGNEEQKLLPDKIANDDYALFLSETGWTDKAVRAISENAEDLCDLPPGHYKIQVANSNIEGKGLFATGNIHKGDYVSPARLDGKRTIAGRYTNHSCTPNAYMNKLDNGDIWLVALKDIKGCKGGMLGEEIMIDYRQVLKL